MQIIGIDHVVIRCIDVKRMMNFYCDVLGCTLEKSREDLGLYHLRAGKSLIDLLSVSTGHDASARNMDHLCLRIDTFDEPALRAHFRGAGIELGEVHDNFGADGDGPSFYLSDPEGNTIELKGPAFL
jgi:glyoxylase I family protein